MAELRAGLLALLLVMMSSAPYVSGYSSGAPPTACNTMVPGHSGTTPQSSSAPFNISVSKTTYAANDAITVTITATGANPVVGLLLQARRADPNLDTTTALGTFTAIANTQATTCSGTAGSALTHTNALVNTFNTLTVTWTAPNPVPGHIEFKATLATSKAVYWVGVTSPIVYDPNSGAIVTTTASTLSTTSDSSEIDVSGCGSTKGCLRTPSGCTGSTCDALVTWAEDSNTNYINFEMSRKSAGYIALGLSSDTAMGDDSVMECLRDSSGSMTVSQSKNVGRSNTEISNPKYEGIDTVKVGYNNGVQVCRFRRQKQVSGRTSDIFDISSTSYHLLMALGNTFVSGSSTEITKHSSTPFITSSKVDLTQKADISVKPTIPALVKAHGSLMLIAWVMCASIGMLIARHYKKHYGDAKICKKDAWFPLHAGWMVTALVCTITAFILIFVYAKGYSNITTDNAFLKAHPILGIIVTALAITNPIMAAFRPAPDASNRKIFNWAHWFVGTTARILAVTTICIGLSLPTVTAGNGLKLLYIMLGFIGFYLVVEIALEIAKCKDKPAEPDPYAENGTSFEMRTQNGTCDKGRPKKSCSWTTRQVLHGMIHSGAVGFTIALVVDLCVD